MRDVLSILREVAALAAVGLLIFAAFAWSDMVEALVLAARAGL